MKNSKKSLMVVAVLAGSIAAMSGCGASNKPTMENTAESAAQVQSVVETQTEVESKTKVVTETETASETETVTETETETASEIETTSKIETEKQSETKSEAELQSEAQKPPMETQTTPEAASEPVSEPVAVAEGSVSEGDFAVVVKGTAIPLGGDMRNYVGLLGEPDDFGSAKSCTEAGDDKVYTYGGAVIYTYITNGADIISLIEVTGGEVLPSGIHIGSTKEEVIAAYGSNYTEDGTELLYQIGNKTIGLQMTNNKVSFMELFGL